MKYIIDYDDFLYNRLNEADVNLPINSVEAIEQREEAQKVNTFNAGKGKLDSVLKEKPEEWEKKAAEVIGNNDYLGLYWDLIKLKQQQNGAQERLKSASPEDAKMAQEDLNHYSERAKEIEKKLQDALNKAKKQ